MKKIDRAIKKPNKVTILTSAIVVITLTIGGVFIYMPFLNRSESLRAMILKERDRNILLERLRV